MSDIIYYYTMALDFSIFPSSTALWANKTDEDCNSNKIWPLHLLIPGSIFSAKSNNPLQTNDFFNKWCVGKSYCLMKKIHTSKIFSKNYCLAI